MDSLLRWSIEHSTPRSADAPPPTRTNLDPEIIDYILGKPDAVLMKDGLEVALDENRDEDARIQALDDFEMLVEQIDNANDLTKLKMWDPLQSLLTSQNSSDEIKLQTLWIIGTAVQNNPSAQNSYLDLDPVPVVLSFLSPTVRSAQLRSKAVYTLSGLCKHNSRAVKQLDKSGGWEALSTALEDSDITVRRKVAFLLNTLMIQSDSGVPGTPSNLRAPGSSSAPVHPNSHASMVSDPSSTMTSKFAVKALEDRGLLQALVRALTAPVPYGQDGELEGDADFEERVVRTLLTYLTARAGRFPRGPMGDADLAALKIFVSQRPDLSERCRVTEDEMGVLLKAVEGA
ncbi:nucleotide exchange factors-like protein [Thelephora ganbajun]|uniref:Nucleotide exchange factors-like protein n=1 Tax=Thelephora ganbajun TaxID=370292 RepID=A0ACB6ZA39_THEGA|nr:nucleotide exchange factors-like protein [Thelephora ganbajun]